MAARTRRPADAVERAADELYGLPLEDFTSARDEHARRLRRERLRSDAEAVKKLRKPTLAAWSLNQLARRRRADVERLLATGERLRKAQEALLARGDRAALQRASADERELVSKLTRDATALAGEAGRASTASLGEQIGATLHAAALDEETAAELAAGRLVRDREAVGLFGAAPADRPDASRKQERDKPRQRAGADGRLERELAAAKAAHEKAEREHTSATQAAERARKRATDAQARADEARTRAEEARAGLRDAEKRERSAVTARDRAARAVDAAEKKLR
jgi:hypothetical protein